MSCEDLYSKLITHPQNYALDIPGPHRTVCAGTDSEPDVQIGFPQMYEYSDRIINRANRSNARARKQFPMIKVLVQPQIPRQHKYGRALFVLNQWVV